MIANSKLKAKALQQLKGNWQEPVLLTLVFMLAFLGISALEFIPLIGFLIQTLLGPVLAAGYLIAILSFYRGDKSNLISKMFEPIQTGYVRYLGTMLLAGLYTFLWMLLLIVPGIIKLLSYMMTPFILKDNPEIEYNKAIKMSREMMSGHKLKLFLLFLSFTGWLILGVLTLSIGFLWILPYLYTTLAAFYEERMASFEANPALLGVVEQEEAEENEEDEKDEKEVEEEKNQQEDS